MFREFREAKEAFAQSELEAWLDKQDAEDAKARQEFDGWLDGQIAEQKAFEQRLDILLNQTSFVR